MDAVFALAMDSLDSHLGNPDHTAADEAEWAGYAVGYEHDLSAGPEAGLDPELARRWQSGHRRGWMDRAMDDRKIDRLGRSEAP